MTIRWRESNPQEFATGAQGRGAVPMRRKVWLSFLAGLVLLAVIGVSAYTEVVKLRANDGMVDHTHQVISSLRHIQSMVTDAETGQRGYLITGDSSYLEPYNQALLTLDEEEATLRALVADNPGQQENRQHLEELVATRLAQLRDVLDLRQRRGISAAGQEILAGKGKQTDEAIRGLVQRMEFQEQALLVQRERRALRTSLISRGVIVLGSVLAFVFVGLALYFLNEDFAGARRMNAELVESKANLERRVEERTADLQVSLEQLRMGRELYAVTLSSIGDGVITTDADCRVTFLNPEAEKLTEWKSEDAAGQPLKHIFPIFNEDTHQPIEDPSRRVLQEKTTVGLANHTVLLTKGGKEVPIADSGAPIRDEAGNILGTVLVFRDCTVEREKEMALREQLALRVRLSQVAESVPGAIFSFLSRPDGSCCFPYTNAVIEEIFGATPEELAADAAVIFERMHPQDLPAVRKYMEECSISLGMWSGEYRVNHPRLGEIWVEGKAIPRRLEDGSILWTGFLQDSTQQRRTARNVREGEARLSAIIHSALNGIVTVDELQDVILFNPAAEQIFGWKESEALGRPLDQFIPARYRAAHRQHLREFGQAQIMGRKMGQRDGIFGVRKNGEEFPLEASISHVEFGGKRVYTVILRDITEEKKAEEELKQQASLLDLAPVMVRDMENRIVFWSRGAEKLYGFTKEEAQDRVSHELLQTEGPLPMHFLDQILRDSGMWEGELAQRTCDGGYVYVASQWVLYHDAKGQPIRILEVNADITARRHAEELQTRSQKLEALGTLAGGIAHDFNNILLAIHGNVNLAMADLPDHHPAQQSLTEIQKAWTRASELVRRILGFSRPQEQKKQAMELQPVIEEALRLVRATLPARVQIVSHFAADVPPVKVDAGQIHQVVVNLATNAAHAIGEKNGTIEVRLDAVNVSEDDTRSTANLEVGRYVRLFVSDDGCGMDRATMNRIFDPFFTTKKQGEGTGLGLSVVHGIVSSHNGAISVTSHLGEGTAFHLYFPVSTERPEVKPETAAAAARPHSERVLYVDDEEALVFLATRMLERSGYHVTGFTDAVTALKEFRAHPQDYDVVVTDLSMPRMSGFEFTEELRGIRKDVPVVLTSGFLQTEDQQRAEELGIRELIQKPATATLLAAALERIFSEQVARTQSAPH
jgi:PAS domain S-box-containing protein